MQTCEKGDWGQYDISFGPMTLSLECGMANQGLATAFSVYHVSEIDLVDTLFEGGCYFLWHKRMTILFLSVLLCIIKSKLFSPEIY